MQFVELMLIYSMNLMIIAGGIWAVLRVVEKVYDIVLKDVEYKRRKEKMENA